MNIEDLPFNKFIDLFDCHNGVSLTIDEHHKNHLGTVHATVLYGIAEACSGKVIIGMLRDGYTDTIAVTRTGNIKYKSPATTNLVAVSTAISDEPADVLGRLKSRGLARLTISVSVKQDDGVVVAEADFKWVLKRP